MSSSEALPSPAALRAGDGGMRLQDTCGQRRAHIAR